MDLFKYLALPQQRNTALELSELEAATTLANTTATFEFDPHEREVYATVPQQDGSLRFRIMVCGRVGEAAGPHVCGGLPRKA